MQSEFRQDVVSGDWILIAPGRKKRANSFVRVGKRPRSLKEGCPFENFENHKNVIISNYFDQGEDWRIKVLANKYPAVVHSHKEPKVIKGGKNSIYSVFPGIGHHELVVTRDHDNDYSKLNIKDASLVLQVFRDRYLEFIKDKNMSYVSIFHNFGVGSGGSIYHPHYQIIAIPIIPPDIRHSLHGSKKYYEVHKKCAHCAMIALEKKDKKRIIFENKSAIVFAPFVSRTPFEMRVFPKEHSPYFEETNPEVMADIAECLQAAINKIDKGLDADYNFFFHTSPILDKKKYHHYHWHIEVLPKLTHLGGFELNTGIAINVVDPNEASKLLRNA